MSVRVVCGAQFGDDGKGKVTDLLAAEADVVIRYQGGNNAGHTVVVGEEEFKLHLVPSGILYPNTTCIMGDGTVIDLEVLAGERDALRLRGVSCENLRVSGNAHVIMPYHKMLDGLDEDSRGAAAVGTTRRGIGPAYSDKAARRGIILWDFQTRERFRDRVRTEVEFHNQTLGLYGQAALEADDVESEIWAHYERLAEHIADTREIVREALGDGASILMEGAQGTYIDLDYGAYPYVTSSHPVSGGACLGTGIGPTASDEVIVVVKAYQTRVGHGVFPTELTDATGDKLRERGVEFGTTTGRPRRCGWLDGVLLRQAAQLNGATAMAVTKLDVLDEFETIRVATSYELDGVTSDAPPGDPRLLDLVQPVYEDFPGWQQSLADCRVWDDLPPAARMYLERVSDIAGVPTTLVAVGPAREQTIRI